MPGHGQRDGGTTYLAGSTLGPTSTEERAARVRFRRALALMAMTLVLPGSAQLACGNRRVGLDRAAGLVRAPAGRGGGAWSSRRCTTSSRSGWSPTSLRCRPCGSR